MNIVMGLQKTVTGKYMIVDISDDNAPLVSFYNELNKEDIAASVLCFLSNPPQPENERVPESRGIG